ncbi:MAG: peptidoglycan-binding domain-containing protein [Candidatus Omnitrophota bacterium]
MARKVLLLVLGMIFVSSLSGCATTRKNNKLEIQGLRNQVSALESQLSAKDEEINSLRESALKSSEMPAKTEQRSGEVKEHPKAKQIQTALKNAGYYQGAVDGKIGKGTREAIKAFQKANNLPADGKVGKKTWAVLKNSLEEKVK